MHKLNFIDSIYGIFYAIKNKTKSLYAKFLQSDRCN